MGRFEIIKEFIAFLWERKLWWITPIMVILGLLSALILLGESGGAIMPFIYAVF